MMNICVIACFICSRIMIMYYVPTHAQDIFIIKYFVTPISSLQKAIKWRRCIDDIRPFLDA